MIDPKDINYTFPASLIPGVMNALYNEKVSGVISLNEIRDAFRIKQMQSKSWLLKEIEKKNIKKDSSILVIGSWLGFTSYCLYRMGFNRITECDPDGRLEGFAKHLNRENRSFLHLSKDVNELDLSSYQIIINTSCEHIANNSWFDNIKNTSIIFLHSNNLEGYDHTNICSSLDEMIVKYPMKLDYSEELKFDSYSRYMLIGAKS
jgi:hypothetical protein